MITRVSHPQHPAGAAGRGRKQGEAGAPEQWGAAPRTAARAAGSPGNISLVLHRDRAGARKPSAQAASSYPCAMFYLFFFFLRFSIFKEGADVCGQGLPAVPRPRAGPAPRTGAVPGPGDVRGGWGGISGPASAAAPPRTLHCSYP